MNHFVIVCRAFGYPMFMSLTPGEVSDNRDEATVFKHGEDNPEIKARHMSAVSGLPFVAESF